MNEEILDIEQPSALIGYLRGGGYIGADETPAIHVLAGGVSNRTVLVQRASEKGEAGEGWVVKQPLAQLRVAVEWFSDIARIHREALGLRWLEKLAPVGSITPLVFGDNEAHILAMEAVPQPHENWKKLLLTGKLERDHIEQFAELLGNIHRGAWERRDELAPVFDDISFFDSLRLEPYYRYTAAQVSEAAKFLSALVADTLAHRLTVVHGDYSPKNVLVYRGRLILLDHEVIHWGDPAFDLGFSLTHLLSKAHHLPELRAEFAAAALQYWNAYRATIADAPWAAELEARAVRHTLGCLLARVAGRSTLEYLSPEERATQRDAVVRLMQNPPSAVETLIQQFIKELTLCP